MFRGGKEAVKEKRKDGEKKNLRKGIKGNKDTRRKEDRRGNSREADEEGRRETEE